MFIISKISPYDGKKHIILLFNKYRISELFYDRFILDIGNHWTGLKGTHFQQVGTLLFLKLAWKYPHLKIQIFSYANWYVIFKIMTIKSDIL